MKNKKGQIDGLMNLVPALVGIAIVLTVGFLIFSEVKTQDTLDSTGGNAIQCAGPHANGSYACNATQEVQEALDDIPGFLPIIVITVIGAILLSLVAYFRTK